MEHEQLRSFYYLSPFPYTNLPALLLLSRIVELLGMEGSSPLSI